MSISRRNPDKNHKKLTFLFFNFPSKVHRNSVMRFTGVGAMFRGGLDPRPNRPGLRAPKFHGQKKVEHVKTRFFR